MSFISASLKDDCCVWSVTVEEEEQLIRSVLQFLDESSLLFVVLRRRWDLGEDNEREIGDDGHGHIHGDDDISTV